MKKTNATQPALADEQRAREYAKAFLLPLIKRGVSFAHVCQYTGVEACMLYVLQIGGVVYYQRKHHRIGDEQLVVKELDGQPCLYVFEVADLFAELDAPLMSLPLSQRSLWEVLP